PSSYSTNNGWLEVELGSRHFLGLRKATDGSCLVQLRETPGLTIFPSSLLTDSTRIAPSFFDDMSFTTTLLNFLRSTTMWRLGDYTPSGEELLSICHMRDTLLGTSTTFSYPMMKSLCRWLSRTDGTLLPKGPFEMSR